MKKKVTQKQYHNFVKFLLISLYVTALLVPIHSNAAKYGLRKMFTNCNNWKDGRFS